MKQENRNPKQRVRTQRRPCRGGSLFIIAGICLLIVSAWQLWKEYMPSYDYAVPDTSIKQPITWEGQSTEYGAYGSGDALMVPMAVVQERMQSHVVYEESSSLVILTNDTHVATIPLQHANGSWNGKSKHWKTSALQVKGEIYVPASLLEELEIVKVIEYANSGAVQLVMPGESLQYGEVKAGKDADKRYVMREQPDLKAPIVKKLASGTSVTMWELNDGWYRIQESDGQLGYMQQSDVVVTTKWSMPAAKSLEEPAFVKKKEPISLAWEAVYSKNPDPNSLPDMPGVNVISPTWFSLADDEGNVNSKADKKIVEWAHQQGKSIWALFSNSFEPERTTAALSTFERRDVTIQQLLGFMKEYDLDGINIDYENVNLEDRHNLTQFVRELTPQFHRMGLVVSIDVTAKSGSDRWSKFLDREALGRSVDYMMVMAYDEHWAASPKAGSVSSLPWADQAVQRIIDEDGVPASKLVLGMPLYSRIWTETEENGETKVKSKAVGMQSVNAWLSEHKVQPVMLEEVGQHYAEALVEGQKQRVWIEDTTSIQARIQMAKDKHLAGVAVWARSFGNEALWKVFDY